MNFAVIDFESSWKEEPVEQNMGPSLCDPQSLIKDLNPQQMEAVKYYGQALLIGAGATHREVFSSVLFARLANKRF